MPDPSSPNPNLILPLGTQVAMKAGVIEANLLMLNQHYPLAYVPDLVAQKLAGPEQSALNDNDFDFYHREYQRLRGELQSAYDSSTLPEMPSSKAGLNDLLLRLRKVR